MKELIFVAEESPDGGYTARCVGEAIFTEAERFEDLKKQYVMLYGVILTISIPKRSYFEW